MTLTYCAIHHSLKSIHEDLRMMVGSELCPGTMAVKEDIDPVLMSFSVFFLVLLFFFKLW